MSASSRLSAVPLLLVAILAIGCSSSADDVDDGATAAQPGSTAADPTTSNPPQQPSSTTTSTTTTTTTPLPFVDACDTARRPGVGVRSDTVISGGAEYVVQWTVPSSYEGEPLPVVIDFHAIGSNGAQQSVFSGFSAMAETEGFVAVHPTGRPTAADDRNGWSFVPFETEARSDVRFTLSLLDFLATQVCVDQERIYVSGMGNGAFLVSDLVCRLADRIAAAVSVGGVHHADDCAPERPVPYLAFHGTADAVVPFEGDDASTLTGDDARADFFERAILDEFGEFADDFGCAEFEDAEPDGAVVRRSWNGCDGDVEVAFYTIDGGGHTWPGSDASAEIEALGPTTFDVDATAVAWAFFGRHTRGGAVEG